MSIKVPAGKCGKIPFLVEYNFDLCYIRITRKTKMQRRDLMDIAELSMANSQSSLMYNVSLAVTKMSMDTAETAGENLVKMMEQSVNPNLGSNIDVRL